MGRGRKSGGSGYRSRRKDQPAFMSDLDRIQRRWATQGRNVPEYLDIVAERNGWTRKVHEGPRTSMRTHRGEVETIYYTSPDGKYEITAHKTGTERPRLSSAIMYNLRTGDRARVEHVYSNTPDKRRAIRQLFASVEKSNRPKKKRK